MRIGASLRWAAVTAFVLAAAGPATAQQPAGTAPPAVPAPDAQVGFERRQQLSPQEELAQADQAIGRMDQASNAVRHQLESARQARDVVKTLCLNDKLSQIDVAARSGRDRQAALQAAVQRNDVELANHEFAILTVLRQRAEQLSAEANQCIGEEVAFVGQTEVHTEINPNLPSEETATYPPLEFPPPVVVPPPPASGTQ
jgi:hypothetical protein